MHRETSQLPNPLIRRIRADARVAALTGAGVSAASGVPTFRGADGLWRHHSPQELATPEAFRRNPELVWQWYAWRRERVRTARPNAAHHALAALARYVRHLGIITQNVDGLHRRAPLPENAALVELHGNLWRTRCTRCHREEEDDAAAPLPRGVPRCPSCGGRLRPAVVWFGEELAPAAFQKAGEFAAGADVFLVVGTSAVVQPAAAFASLARRSGAYVAEFNLERTALSESCDSVILGPCEETLPAVLEALEGG